MREKYSSDFLKYLAYRKEQNLLRKTFYDLFPNLYIGNLKKIYQVLFELSSRCNLKCPFCTNQFRETGKHMTYEKAVEYFHKLPKTLKALQLHFSGESFLNPEISRITGFLAGQGLFLSVSTNGTLPAERYLEVLESGLSQLVFAIDGATPETHEKYRVGSSFEKIVSTLQTIIKNKPGKARVGVQYLVTRYNETEIGRMKDWLKEAGADFFHLKTLSLDIAADERLSGERVKNAREFLPRNEKYSRYRFEKKDLKLKYPILICPFIFEPVIGADGEVSLCCIDLEKQIKIGNLDDFASFEELWNSAPYRDIRRKGKSKKLPVCRKCNFSLTGLREARLN